jgi:hypothetical protein
VFQAGFVQFAPRSLPQSSYFVVVPIQRISARFKKPPATAATRACSEYLSEARRCAHCTAGDCRQRQRRGRAVDAARGRAGIHAHRPENCSWDPLSGCRVSLRAGGSVRGMTTAAGIWVVGAIGVACGAGLYVIAVIAPADAGHPQRAGQAGTERFAALEDVGQAVCPPMHRARGHAAAPLAPAVAP